MMVTRHISKGFLHISQNKIQGPFKELQTQFLKALKMLNPDLKTPNLLFCNMINADKHKIIYI